MNTSTQSSGTDTIRKQVQVKAEIGRVWKALTDHREFGTWFRVSLAEPFAVGKRVKGNILYPGYEHLEFQCVVERMDEPRLFSFRWHPYAVDPKQDYAKEPMTLVELRLEEVKGGTLVTVIESGFDRIPSGRRAEAFRMNDGGWAEQMCNIKKHVDG